MSSPTRRRFLRDASTATAATMLPPFFLQTSSKSGSRLPVVGFGVHTYECVHDWLVPPDGLVWGDTHGLAQDEQGNITIRPGDSFAHLGRNFVEARMGLVCAARKARKFSITAISISARL
jgi:hypothetical protein